MFICLYIDIWANITLGTDFSTHTHATCPKTAILQSSYHGPSWLNLAQIDSTQKKHMGMFVCITIIIVHLIITSAENTPFRIRARFRKQVGMIIGTHTPEVAKVKFHWKIPPDISS